MPTMETLDHGGNKNHVIRLDTHKKTRAHEEALQVAHEQIKTPHRNGTRSDSEWWKKINTTREIICDLESLLFEVEEGTAVEKNFELALARATLVKHGQFDAAEMVSSLFDENAPF